MEKLIKLFECCYLTLGVNRSLIIDTQRQSYFLIPNALAHLFDRNRVFNVHDFIDHDEHSATISEYINFLFDNELCFYCDENLINNFPAIDYNNWDYPSHITNAIFEVAAINFYHRFNIFEKLINKYLIKHIEIHICNALNFNLFEEFLLKINSLDLSSYNIIFSLENEKDLNKVINTLQIHHNIYRSLIYNASEDIIIKSGKEYGNIFLIKNNFTYKSCGIINQSYFTLTKNHITESQNHNTCLNRKLTIDVDGNIKNCPNTPEKYGNIMDDSQSDFFDNLNFKKIWKIKKDDILVCKDCEFRHICTDCRAFITDPNNIYSKPLKCGYDPYTCEWENWSTNPINSKVMKQYGLS